MIAAADRVWEAVVTTAMGALGGSGKERFARLLGCAQTANRGEPGTAGSTLVGFRVAEAEPPRLLRLEGEHRFSRYRLTFRIEPRGASTRVSAATHAEFLGAAGRAYRALVVGSRGHLLLVNRMLRAVRRRSERGVRA